MMLYSSNCDSNLQEIKDDILERTCQMKSLCLDAETIAIQTVVTLADQDEQLKNIHLHLSSIDTTLLDTKQHINRLKGITQRLVDIFRIKFHRKDPSKFILHTKKQPNSLSSPLRRRSQSSSKIIQHKTASIDTIIEGQIDDTLYDIGNVVRRLKDRAQDMNDQLVGQADTLHHIHDHMIKSTDHIGKQNTDIKKYLNKLEK